MMKSILLFIALSLVLYVDASIEESVAIRMLFNNGQRGNLGAVCTRPEVDVIQSTLVKAIQQKQQPNGLSKETMPSKLRGRGSLSIASTDTSYCKERCIGTSPGTCWLVDESCKSPHNDHNTNVVESQIHIDLVNDQDLTQKQLETCQIARQAIIHEMELSLENSTTLSNSCKEMLRQKVNLSCVKVPSNSNTSLQQ